MIPDWNFRSVNHVCLTCSEQDLVNCEINRSYRSPVPLQCRGFLGRICIYGVRKKEEAGRGSCHGISLSLTLLPVC